MRKFLLRILFVFSSSQNLFSQSDGFIAAYDSMHQKFRVWYAFGEWKAVDWVA